MSAELRAFTARCSSSCVRFRRAIFCFRSRLNLDLSPFRADMVNSRCEEGEPALDLHDLRSIARTRLKPRWNAAVETTDVQTAHSEQSQDDSPRDVLLRTQNFFAKIFQRLVSPALAAVWEK